MTSVDRDDRLSLDREILAQTRVEKQLSVPQADLERVQRFLRENFEGQHYSDPWVYTIYFGGIKIDENGQETISSLGKEAGVGLKARMFSAEALRGQASFINPLIPVRFEAKFRPLDNSDGRRKYQVKQTTFRELIEALTYGDHQTFCNKYNFPPQLLSDILKRCGCSKYVPVGMVEYQREHYISLDGTLRCTLDTNFNVLKIDSIDHLLYAAVKIGESETNVLEIKSFHGLHNYPTELSELVGSLSEASSKHSVLFNKVGTETKVIYEVDYDPSSEGWQMLEVEKKIDVTQDLRPWLREVTLGDRFTLNDPDEQNTRQSFYVTNDDRISVCIMEYLTIKKAASIKAKVSTDSSHENRTELVLKNSPESREKVAVFIGMNLDQLQLSPSFERQRVARAIISQQTGRTFLLVADHCVSEDGRPALNQLEIEYSGTLSALHSEKPEITLDAEMLALIEILTESLTESGFTILPTKKTKSSWISAQS